MTFNPACLKLEFVALVKTVLIAITGNFFTFNHSVSLYNKKLKDKKDLRTKKMFKPITHLPCTSFKKVLKVGLQCSNQVYYCWPWRKSTQNKISWTVKRYQRHNFSMTERQVWTNCLWKYLRHYICDKKKLASYYIL